MSEDPLHAFAARERAKQQAWEEEKLQRQEGFERRQRMAAALRPLLDLLPRSGPNAERLPFSEDCRRRISAALLTVGEAMRAEGSAPTVIALKAGPDAHGSALRLMQRAAAEDERGIAQDLALLTEIPERARQDVWDELRNVADQLLNDWPKIRLALQQAAEGTGAPHNQGGAGQGEGAGIDPTQREKHIRQMQPAIRRAWRSFEFAALKAGKSLDKLTGPEAHDLLKEADFRDEKDAHRELADYELPDFNTWDRYVRGARRQLGEQKYTPRVGRPTGKSIVSSDQIERTEDAE